MDETAFKKQRVSFEDAANSTLDSSLFSFRSNDIIDLVFAESPESTATHKPDYTHQLFDNETVQLSVDLNTNPRIKVVVNCSDLSHSITYPATLSKTDVETLAAGIHKALPEGCAEPVNDTETAMKVSSVTDSVKSVPPGSPVFSCNNSL